jgi:PAS domain S-box-containing protein
MTAHQAERRSIDRSWGKDLNCLWTLDLDGRILHLNEASARFSDVTAREAVGTFWRDHWPEESSFSLDRAFAAATRGGVARFRSFDQRKLRTASYFEAIVAPVFGPDGQVSAITAVAQNVTEGVESAALMASVVQSLPSPLTVTAADTGRYVLWNRAAEAAFGVDAEQALGRTPNELFAADLATAVSGAEAGQLGMGETRVTHGVRLPEAMGGAVYDIKSMATFDDQGPRHVINLAEDITGRLAQAEALQQALEATERASQAKSAFLANMSHEVRTPMNSIVACADLLSRANLDPAAREQVEMIDLAGRTLRRLLDDVLDVVQMEAEKLRIEPKPFKMQDLARTVEAAARGELTGSEVTFAFTCPPALQDVMGDEVRLGQVLSNLVGNAIKFTDRGEVALDIEEIAPGRVRFEVRDTGVGFSSADKDRIFERFQQADNSMTRRFGGVGLGLTIARDLVALMGGTLDCDSAPGVGSRFWFTLPLPAADEGRDLETDLSEGAGDQAVLSDGLLKVLVADDHPANRRIVEIMLDGSAEVISVENGLEAVEVFQRQRPDLVLMDMQMPVMDGLAAIEEIRRLEIAAGQTRLPIIMLTANAAEEHVHASLRAGADRHLAKPITAETLFTALQAVLN